MAMVVVARDFGGPEVLALVDLPLADPGPGQVRVAVRAAGVNPIDAKVYSGAFGRDPATLPLRIGGEATGVVTAIGSQASGPAGPISVGDKVIGYRVSGACADELVVAADSLLPKPDAMSWAEASGLMLCGATAIHTLTATAVGAGDTVLVHGGAGGVGQLAIQIARARGARVIATASPARHDFIRELGAQPVSYGDGLTERVRALAPDGVQAALDLVGTDEAVDTSLELVADRNRIATIAAFARGHGAGIKVLGGGPGADPGTEIRTAARLELVRLVEAGALHVHVTQTFALADVAEAHRVVLGGHSTGKIALIV
jgi:NADPH:quinone reductase-like Zn-dependent oxidoreductase